MARSRERRFGLRDAIGLSIVLHLLAAPLFAVSGAVLFGAGLSFELAGARDDSFAITLERNPSVRHPVRRTRPLPAAKSEPLKDARAVAATHDISQPHLSPNQLSSVRRGGGDATITRLTIISHKSVAHDVSAPIVVADDATPMPVQVMVPTVEPTAAPEVSLAGALPAVRRGFDATIGGWGQNFERPLVADENALNELRAKYHLSVTITIRVDENGRAVKVNVPDSLPSEVKSEIERRLAALRYIPAECNGLHCASSLSIVI